MFALLPLLGCLQYDLGGDDEPKLIPADDPDAPVDDTADTDVAEEICNGADDDGDGAVDEGFADHDGDGTADCVDATCAVEEVFPVDVDDPAPLADPWAVRELWAFAGEGPTVNRGAVIPPLVATLTDDDGDGDVDADDGPDVIFLYAYSLNPDGGADIVVLDGATGTVFSRTPGAYLGRSLAVADLDGDDVPEILAWDAAGALFALEADGTELWRETVLGYSGGLPTVTVADFDGDGALEVVAEGLVLDGATGATLVVLDGDNVVNGAPNTTADLDLDGSEEILYGGAAYAADGAQLWDAGTPEELLYPVVVQADADPEAEVVQVGAGSFRVRDTDGTVLVDADLAAPGPYVGAPCAADFDGDGAIEIAFTTEAGAHVWEIDGTEVWRASVSGGSPPAGCTAFDFDADGRAELVLATRDTLLVLDGVTGAERIAEGGISSGYMMSYATIADVDQDGHADLLVPSNGPTTAEGLVVYTHDGDGWPAASDAWTTHAYTPDRFDTLGRATADGAWWQDSERLRSAGSPTWPDAEVRAGDTCVASCDPTGEVRVAVTVASVGTLPVTGYTLVLARVDLGVVTELDRVEVAGTLGIGDTSGSHVFVVTAGDIGSEGLRVTVSTAADGDAGNDQVVIDDLGCE